MDNKSIILGLPYCSYKYKEAVNYLIKTAKRRNVKLSVFTPNVQHFYLYHHNISFKHAYDNCDISLVDGKPLVWLINLLKESKTDKISGSDFVIELLEKSKKESLSVYILGGAEGVAKKAIEKTCGSSIINKSAFYSSPPLGFEKDQYQNNKIIDEINLKKPDILFVALGAPKQEVWITKNLNDLNVGLAIGVGGSIDFIAGFQKRAPKWMQKIGLEWLFRLLSNPRRLFLRYAITNTFFIYQIIKAIIAKSLKK
jgi:N-acetylglucosaminyldiphosphoundecaprenol N-acetyl-beta-D-mannosaminyltransferase